MILTALGVSYRIGDTSILETKARDEIAHAERELELARRRVLICEEALQIVHSQRSLENEMQQATIEILKKDSDEAAARKVPLPTLTSAVPTNPVPDPDPDPDP